MKTQSKIEFKYSEDNITFEEFNDGSYYIKYPAVDLRLEKTLNRIANRITNFNEKLLVIKYYFCVLALKGNYAPEPNTTITVLLKDTIEELTNKNLLLEITQLLPKYTSSSKGVIEIVAMNTNHLNNAIKHKIKNNELDDELNHLLNELFERAKENDKNNQE